MTHPESDRANTPPVIFYDRHGNVVDPDARSFIKPRRGVFALVAAVDDEAIRREWSEEVGIPFNVEGPFQQFQHVRGFYADDRREFWIYDQTFRLYHYLDRVKIGPKWLNSEGGTTGWEAIASLSTLSINRAHWCAIPTLLSSLGFKTVQ